MGTPGRSLGAGLEAGLWPLVDSFTTTHDVAGLAMAVVREDEVVTRCWGVRDVRLGEPVTSQTLFHLASVSKPVVAAALVSLSMTGDDGRPRLDLDAPVTRWVPELTLADGRADEVTARRLLSHSSGLPDTTEYGWHEPQLGDDALGDFVRSMAGWRLQSEPGSTISYSNAGYELLGLLLARVAGTTFEDAVKRLVLMPIGMRHSTFLRAEVPPDLACSPHVGSPLSVPEGAYPYTRQHAPSSSLHSNLDELCRWVTAHFESFRAGPRLDPWLVERMWQPQLRIGRQPWDEAVGLGWSLGSYRGHQTVSHSGMDPGFMARLALVPEKRTGVVVLANSNTVPVSALARATLDIALADAPFSLDSGKPPDELDDGLRAMWGLKPPVVRPVARLLASTGPEAAAAEYHRLAALETSGFDLDDEGFTDAVWGAIELHRTGLVRPLLQVWTELRPESSPAWTMTGWASQVDGNLDRASEQLRRALALDPGNDEAAALLRGLAGA